MDSIRCIRLFNIYNENYKTGFAGNVWSIDGISPTLQTMEGGNRQPLILEMCESDFFQTIIGSKQQNAYRGSVCDISPTITSAMGMGGGMIPLLTNATIEQTKTLKFMKELRGKSDLPKEVSEDCEKREEQAAKQKIQLPPELQGKKFRIRKLTPRECGRLMDVDDADIDKIEATGLSNSSMYRLYGNSIVVSVLYHIFRKAFIETDPDIVSGAPQQLTLF